MRKLAIPFAFDSIHGSVKVADEREEITSSVKTILMTAVHERILSPQFGSRLNDYVFSEMNYTTLELLKKEVITSLEAQEPRVYDIQISFETQQLKGILMVYVSYRIYCEQTMEALTLQLTQEGITL